MDKKAKKQWIRSTVGQETRVEYVHQGIIIPHHNPISVKNSQNPMEE